MHPGGAQLLLLAVGIFFAAGTSGPAGAMVANLTRESIRSTAFGTLTLANNLLGLAAGPLVVGILADRFGLVARHAARAAGRRRRADRPAASAARPTRPASPRCAAQEVTR